MLQKIVSERVEHTYSFRVVVNSNFFFAIDRSFFKGPVGWSLSAELSAALWAHRV